MTDKNNFKILLKWFCVLAILCLGVANYSRVCLFTDYRFLSGKLYGFALAKGLIEENKNIGSEQGTIKITEIGLKAPLVLPKSPNLKDIEKALKQGAVLYPNSALPGKKGVSVILGHSAPANWPKAGNYDWIFSQLNNLEKGDDFSLFFNDQQYFYKVVSKEIINKGQNLPLNDDNDLVLISCWPPGRNQKRIAVSAMLR